ncbi:MAG TPA: hypothetical protein VJM46_02975 [Candidatus Saccharimonadales bacterium]|nr:hypothetical protein [Candidatus Saccharimonadales bacterium]
MSLQHSPTANLPGYGAPNYPRLVASLATALVNGAPLTPAAIERAARLVPGYNTSAPAATTADGYIWMRVLEFGLRTARSVIAVAIPHARDYGRADGSQLDRMPAVYLRHGATVDEANAVIGLLLSHL